ncbi:MAG: hypothetical protein KF901_02305 [Myxococcales bacterium]|nr:hypothetical protein [Myxococcales bacterium]
MRYARSSLVLVALLFSFGCGDDDGDRPGADSGTPVPGTDSGTPIPGTDSGTPIPGTDSGTVDPGTDSGTVDPGTDAGMTDPARDPRLQSDPRAGYVSCGGASCEVPMNACCTSMSGQTCGPPSSCSGGLIAQPGYCDGPEDCAGGQVCCAPGGLSDVFAGTGTTCEASCTGTRVMMCQTDADCLAGSACHTCWPPMRMGNIVGICGAAGGGCPSPYENP